MIQQRNAWEDYITHKSQTEIPAVQIYFSHQPVCYYRETQWDMSAQILAPAPAPLVSWKTAESSCCKQVWGTHIDTYVSSLAKTVPNVSLIISEKEQKYCGSPSIIVLSSSDRLDQTESFKAAE